MKNKFCSNKANSNKNSFNSQYENTRHLYEIASECEADFLSVSYEHISPRNNEFSIKIIKELNNITRNSDSTSDSDESEVSSEFSHNGSFKL